MFNLYQFLLENLTYKVNYLYFLYLQKEDSYLKQKRFQILNLKPFNLSSIILFIEQ